MHAGALVLGQMQNCLGGCFSPGYALDGDMANVRVWDRVLSKVGANSAEAAASNGCRMNQFR